jgi:hypothetical protein
VELLKTSTTSVIYLIVGKLRRPRRVILAPHRE